MAHFGKEDSLMLTLGGLRSYLDFLVGAEFLMHHLFCCKPIDSKHSAAAYMGLFHPAEHHLTI